MHNSGRTQNQFFSPSPQRAQTSQQSTRVNKMGGSPKEVPRDNHFFVNVPRDEQYKNLDKILQSTDSYKTMSGFHRVKYEKFPKFPNQNIQKENNNQNQQIKKIGPINKYSNIFYILGQYSNDFLYIIDNRKKLEEQTNEAIYRMKTSEFLKIQHDRTFKMINILSKFFYEQIKDDKNEKDTSLKEISQLLKQELNMILTFHEKFINNMEENFKKFHLFKDREIILEADFYQALKILVQCYQTQSHTDFSLNNQKSLNKKLQKQPSEQIADQQIYIKSLSHYKSFLKADEKNKDISQIFEDIEYLLKTQYEKLDNLTTKVQELETQQEKYSQLYQELVNEKNEYSLQKTKNFKEKKQQQDSEQIQVDSVGQRFHDSKHEVSHNQQEQSEVSSQSVFLKRVNTKVQEQSKTEALLGQHYNDLKNENRVLNQKLKEAAKRIQIINSISINQDGAKKRPEDQMNTSILGIILKQDQAQQKTLKKCLTDDKATQFIAPSEQDYVSKRDNCISLIVEKPLYYMKGANLQTKEWTSLVINSMLTDKCLSSIYDEADLMPNNSLNAYMVEWFLKKFGSKEISELFLKDFLFSVKKYGIYHERFKLFCSFSNLESLYEQNVIEIQTYSAKDLQVLNRQKFRSQYLKSNEALEYYYKLANNVRHLMNFNNTNSYLPFLSNINKRCMDLVNADLALKIWQTFIQDEQLTKIEPLQIEDIFKKLHDKDVKQRPTDPFGVYDSMEKEEEELYIRFDVFAKAVIDSVVDQRFYEISDLYNQIKAKLDQDSFDSYARITHEDFRRFFLKNFQKKSSRAADMAYRIFVDSINSDKTPLAYCIENLGVAITEEGTVKSNMFKIQVHLLNQEEEKKDNKQQAQTKKNMLKQQMPKSKMGNQSIFKTMKSSQNGNDPSAPYTGQENSLQNQEREKLIQLYDPVTNLALAEETYRIIQPMITHLEKKYPELQQTHFKLLEDAENLPKSVIMLTKYEEFEQYQDKKDIVDLVEKQWQKLRQIFSILSRNLSDPSYQNFFTQNQSNNE